METPLESLVPALSGVQIVLVDPQYDGNLGKVARAMCNFGLSRLTLVGGRADPDSDEARWYGREEGGPLLDRTRRVSTLDEAIAESSVVVGATRRLGKRKKAGQPPEDLFDELVPWSRPYEMSILFGHEANGLPMEAVDRCHHLLWIPTDPVCPSMNLSHAVVVTGYALARCARAGLDLQAENEPLVPARAESLEAMYQHARQVWLRIGYLHYQNPDAILRKWRQIFSRTHLTEYDVRVVRALLHQTEWVAKVAGIPPGGPQDSPPELFDKHSPPPEPQVRGDQDSEGSNG